MNCDKVHQSDCSGSNWFNYLKFTQQSVVGKSIFYTTIPFRSNGGTCVDLQWHEQILLEGQSPLRSMAIL